MAEQLKPTNQLSKHFKEILFGIIISVISGAIIAWFGLDKLNTTKCLDPNLSHTVTGTWEQHVRHYGTQEWFYAGVYKVYIDGECLAMIPENVSTVSQILSTPNGIVDVKFDGTKWSFRSHSQDGSVVLFELERITDSLYVGSSYIDGNLWDENQWTKLPNR